MLDIAEKQLQVEYPAKQFVMHLCEKFQEFKVDYDSVLQSFKQWTPPQLDQLITCSMQSRIVVRTSFSVDSIRKLWKDALKSNTTCVTV